jgi:electron transfer flavoprotein alpha subunit
MDTILVLCHTEADGTLAKAALEVLSAGIQLGGKLAVGLIGADLKAAADSIAGCGAARFLGVAGADFAQARYASDVAAAEAICRVASPELVLVAATSRWNRVLAGVAHRLGGCVDTHVTGLNSAAGALSVNRWYYRQRMEATLTRSKQPWCLALESGCWQAWSGVQGSAALESVAVTLPAEALATTVRGVKAPDADQQTIRPDAGLLFVAGAGWTKKQADGKTHVDEAIKTITTFLGQSKASLGGTKSLVDQGGEGQAVLPFMTHMNQIGQTGATPRHPKGLSTCCHGEEPHVIGWRFINERRAVNLDPNCGWAHGKADVLYVADAMQVMAKVNEILAAKKQKV